MPDFRKDLYDKYNSTFKKYYDQVDSTIYKSYYKYFCFKYLPLIKNFSKDSLILDLGCGQGLLMNFLIDSGFTKVEGVDISEEQISIALKKGLNARVANAFQFLSGDKKYDIIFAMDFIEHFKKDELIELVEKFFNSISDNGCLILRTPNGNGIYPNKIIYGDLTHLTIFNSSSIFQLLRLVGFESIDFFETGPVPKNLKGAIGFVLWNIEKLLFNFFRFIEVGSTEKYLTQEFICKAIKKANS